MTDAISDKEPVLPPDAPGSAPQIDSRTAFHAALRWGIATAMQQGARRLVCSDADFNEWVPLDEPAVLQDLTAWLKQPQRRLVLLARHYDDVPRRWPRFTAWRRDWQHAVDAWRAPAEMAAGLPTLLVADRGVSVHLIDAVHWRGRAALDERCAHQWREQIDAVLQRSEAAFSASTLGL